MSYLVLIVDDEADLVEIVAHNLRREGHATREAYDGPSALRAARQAPTPDLVLLDLNLPGLPGLEVCRQLKQDPATRGIPIVMLTARAEDTDRIVGFELGADDYVTKPFNVRELMLRVRAVLRRGADPAAAQVLVAGPLRLELGSHRAFVGEQELELTALEFRLLHAFVSRRGRVQTREMLLADVWDVHVDLSTRTVDTHVKRLRSKLGEAAELIETLRGVGYRLRPED